MVKIKVPKSKAYVGLKVFYVDSTGNIRKGEVIVVNGTVDMKVRWEDGGTSVERGTAIEYNVFYYLEPVTKNQSITPGSMLVMLQKDDDVEEAEIVEYIENCGEGLSKVLTADKKLRAIWNGRFAIHPGYAPSLEHPLQNKDLRIGDYVTVPMSIPNKTYEPGIAYRIVRSKENDTSFQLCGGEYWFTRAELLKIPKPVCSFEIGEKAKYKGNTCIIMSLSRDGKKAGLGIGTGLHDLNDFFKIEERAVEQTSQEPIKSKEEQSDIKVGDFVMVENTSTNNYRDDLVYRVSAIICSTKFEIGGFTRFDKSDLRKVPDPSRYGFSIGDTIIIRNPDDTLLRCGWREGAKATIRSMEPSGTMASFSVVNVGVLYDMRYMVKDVDTSEVTIGDYVELCSEIGYPYVRGNIYRVSSATADKIFLGGHLSFRPTELIKTTNPCCFEIGEEVTVTIVNSSLEERLWKKGDKGRVASISSDGKYIALSITESAKYPVHYFTSQKSINSQIKHTENDNRANTGPTESAVVKVQRTSPAIRSGAPVGGCAIRIRKRTTTG